MLKGIVLGILLGFVLVFLGAISIFQDRAGSGGRNSLLKCRLKGNLRGWPCMPILDKQPHLNPGVPEDEKNFLEGAKVYKEHCAVCHGLPGEPKTMIADGMFPKPPQLFKGVGVTDDEAWETYWKVAHGIRMTGMPGFKDRLGETKMWQVSLFLKDADKLPASVKAELAPVR